MKKIIAIVGFLGFFASQALLSSAAYFNADPIDKCETQITKFLQKGSENNDVYVLQQMLSNAGFLGAAPNGYFGYQTESAVRAFQRANSLPSTGTVGSMTRNSVNERLCDVDLLDNTYSAYSQYGSFGMYGGYDGYSSGITYVDQNDPFVKVISPLETIPAVYATPQTFSRSSVVKISPTNLSSFDSSYFSPFTTSNSIASAQIATQVSSQDGIAGVGVVYNPSSGYTYNIIPKSGSITVASPLVNSIYKEGDTVNLRWITKNIQVTKFSIFLESTITRQSKFIASTGENSYSVVLTKELLDAVCAGACNNNQQGSFKIVVSTPTTDIAGNGFDLRASVAQVTITRPYTQGKLLLTVSKTPVSSGEIFRLYVNVPMGMNASSYMYSNNTDYASYTVKIKSQCPSSVTLSLAGALCGQEIIVPYEVSRFSQGIPVSVTNPTWYRQDVSFQVALIAPNGQVVSDADTRVTVNATPFSW